MLNTVHAGGELGWKSGHLEPFLFGGRGFKIARRAGPSKSLKTRRLKGGGSPEGLTPQAGFSTSF